MKRAREVAAPRTPIEVECDNLDQVRSALVAEADVISSLEKGDLKGKKIGSAWRVTRAAVDQFLGS